ncbi:MAG TPA: response regulator [Syntrophorhabdaceae bacterium]|nr:response regulator [Syntrophorhabdaceae bacterium]
MYDSNSTPDERITAGEYLEIKVADTGEGISPQAINRIFEPFFTTKGVGEGTGMGLAVVYGTVNNLQGIITVESEPGKGATFKVVLPLSKGAESSKEAAPYQELRGSEHILFVDDEEFLKEWGQAVLERLGYTVTAVTDSAEALRLFSSDPKRFDLVITDQTMPKMTGLQLARELAKIRGDIPIVLCSGHNDEISAQNIENTGIRKFAMKPLAKKELAEIIRNVLEKKCS